MKLSQIKRIYPKKQQREFETEILGIPEDSGEGYIDSQLLEALKDKPRFVLAETDSFTEVWVGIDPLSHNRSEMGLAAIAYSSRGEKVILGCAAVPTKRPMLVEVKEAVKMFLARLRNHPGCALIPIVPIVECNNNEVYAHGTAPHPTNRPKSTPALTRGGGGQSSSQSLTNFRP